MKTKQINIFNHTGFVIWFTGLSGAGKTTLAIEIEKELRDLRFFSKILDGDQVRNGLNKDLGFSKEDRTENIRRIAEVSKLLISEGIICINSFITPTQELRELAKSIVGAPNYFEVFLSTPIETCEARDVKGLYKAARAGEIKGFTGVDGVYEIPICPDLILDTSLLSIQESVEKCVHLILPKLKQANEEKMG
jgi:adenylylsulfate kinase